MEQQKQNVFFSLTAIAAGLFIFGVIYAYRIANYPFGHKKTWQSVVIGDSITDLGMSAMLYVVTQSKLAMIIPWICHGITGLPMILGQLLKNNVNLSETEVVLRSVRENDDNA